MPATRSAASNLSPASPARIASPTSAGVVVAGGGGMLGAREAARRKSVSTTAPSTDRAVTVASSAGAVMTTAPGRRAAAASSLPLSTSAGVQRTRQRDTGPFPRGPSHDRHGPARGGQLDGPGRHLAQPPQARRHDLTRRRAGHRHEPAEDPVEGDGPGVGMVAAGDDDRLAPGPATGVGPDGGAQGHHLVCGQRLDARSTGPQDQSPVDPRALQPRRPCRHHDLDRDGVSGRGRRRLGLPEGAEAGRSGGPGDGGGQLDQLGLQVGRHHGLHGRVGQLGGVLEGIAGVLQQPLGGAQPAQPVGLEQAQLLGRGLTGCLDLDQRVPLRVLGAGAHLGQCLPPVAAERGGTRSIEPHQRGDRSGRPLTRKIPARRRYAPTSGPFVQERARGGSSDPGRLVIDATGIRAGARSPTEPAGRRAPAAPPTRRGGRPRHGRVAPPRAGAPAAGSSAE